jgi:hypothetical protein
LTVTTNQLINFHFYGNNPIEGSFGMIRKCFKKNFTALDASIDKSKRDREIIKHYDSNRGFSKTSKNDHYKAIEIKKNENEKPLIVLEKKKNIQIKISYNEEQLQQAEDYLKEYKQHHSKTLRETCHKRSTVQTINTLTTNILFDVEISNLINDMEEIELLNDNTIIPSIQFQGTISKGSQKKLIEKCSFLNGCTKKTAKTCKSGMCFEHCKGKNGCKIKSHIKK